MSQRNDKTGLISINAVIAGNSYALAVDSGSVYSWFRIETVLQWLKAHPDWQRGKGAVGEANTQTRSDGAEAAATILRLPEIDLASLHLEQIGALGIAPQAPSFPPVPGESAVSGDFFDWYSKKAPAPVIGWLGGNGANEDKCVLKVLRSSSSLRDGRLTYIRRQTRR